MTAVIKSGGVELLCAGKIVLDARYCKKFGANVTVYPVGYTATRTGPSKDGKGSVVFTSTIAEGANGPQFFVTAADEEDGVKHSGENPTAAWVAALSSRVQGEKPAPPNGPLKFGLSIDAVIAELKKLDGYDALVGLVVKPQAAEVDAPATAVKTSKAPVKGSSAPPPVAVVPPSDSADVAVATVGVDAALPKKPTRASKKLPVEGQAIPPAPSKADAPATVGESSTKKRPRASGTAPVTKCELCGLSAPFCSQSGKIHAFAITPCPVCKKITMFCCETGAAHAPVHQPHTATAAAVASSPVAASAASDPTVASKAPRKKTEKKIADESGATVVQVAEGDATSTPVDGTAPKAAKKPRKEKPATQDAGPSATAAAVVDVDGAVVPAPPAPPVAAKGKRQRTLDEVAKKPPTAPEDIVIVVKEPPPPPPPKPFVYPPLRTVASKIDHNAFAKTLQTTPDESTQKRMDADGVTTAAAVKRYTHFLSMYVSEKTVQDAAKAHKATATAVKEVVSGKDEAAAATETQPAVAAAVAVANEEAAVADATVVDIEPKKSKSRRGTSTKSTEVAE